MNERERAGWYAFRQGYKAGECPYCFDQTDCWPNDVERFNREYRAKMDDWMRGWIKAQSQNHKTRGPWPKKH